MSDVTSVCGGVTCYTGDRGKVEESGLAKWESHRSGREKENKLEVKYQVSERRRGTVFIKHLLLITLGQQNIPFNRASLRSFAEKDCCLRLHAAN